MLSNLLVRRMIIWNDNTRGKSKLGRIIIIKAIKHVQQLSGSHGHNLTSIDRHIFLYVSIMESCKRNRQVFFNKNARENSPTSNYPEKSHRWSAIERAVSDFCLCRQVVRILNRRYHPLDSQEGSEIRCVAWKANVFTRRRENLRDNSADLPRDDNQREKPPDSAHDASACCLNTNIRRSLCVLEKSGSHLWVQVGALLHKRADYEPETNGRGSLFEVIERIKRRKAARLTCSKA